MTTTALQDLHELEIEQLLHESGGEEAWNADHALIAESGELESVVQRGLDWYERIRALDRRYCSVVRKNLGDNENALIAHQIEWLYKWWIRPCESILSASGRLRQKGIAISGAEKLLQFYNDCPARGFDLQGTASALQRVAEGNKVSNEEALDALRRKLGS